MDADESGLLGAVVRSYDVRGVADAELDEDLLHRFGAAFVRLTGARAVVVGQDMRASSPRFADAFSGGVRERGADAVRIGLASTDLLHFASGVLGLPGAMITASHHPPRYNGVKLCRAGAIPVGADSGLGDLAALVLAGQRPAARAGRELTASVVDAYRERLLSLAAPPQRPLTVVVDALNGMGGMTVPLVLDGLGVKVVPLHFEVDGAFPGADADPTASANTAWLRAEVQRVGADLGLAFDGDADRCVVVDETGTQVRPSAVGAVLAERALDRVPGATVVSTAATSPALADTVIGLGGRHALSPVGHSNVKRTMAETGAVLGVEHSAHYYFGEFFNLDSGLLAGLHVLGAADGGTPVSALTRRHVRGAALPETTIPVTDPVERLRAVHAVFAAVPSAAVCVVDGVSARLSDGAWFNLRSSNTESRSRLRLNVEAATEESARALGDRVRGLVTDDQEEQSR
ncbi:phosphomannomutase/phosphoglucomutase [Saccharopolyspora sp. 5N708]|uniref:phosphomannomutase/phosphoglucomutase n=1 Tax=Saccharopolyspora sp. 5N708 TaxID=3457424 RepID=UPI003FD26305